MIRSVLFLLWLGFGMIFVLPWFILWSWLTKNPELMYAVAMSVVRGSTRIAGAQLTLEGIENLPSGAAVFVSNHVSNLDPLALLPAMPRRISVLVKQELFRIPILATGMRMAGFVPVNRRDREAAAGSLEVAAETLRGGLSMLVFPEGTRSPDGHMRPFKRGAFVLAIEAGVPIVPVSVVGTQYVLRKGSWKMRRGPVSIRFGPAVDASAYSQDRRAELIARVEALVAAGLPESQQPPGASAAASAANSGQ